MWITRGKLFNNLGYLTFITVVFVIWTRKRPPISLRSFNTRSIPSSAASRTFCGKNRSRARARNRNDRVDLGSRLRHDRGRALDGRVLDSIVPVIAAFEAFLSEFLVVGIVRVFKVGSTGGGIGVGVGYDNGKRSEY